MRLLPLPPRPTETFVLPLKVSKRQQKNDSLLLQRLCIGTASWNVIYIWSTNNSHSLAVFCRHLWTFISDSRLKQVLRGDKIFLFILVGFLNTKKIGKRDLFIFIAPGVTSFSLSNCTEEFGLHIVLLYAAINFIKNQPPPPPPRQAPETRLEEGENHCVRKPFPRDKTGSQMPHPRDIKLENFTNVSINSDTIWNEKLCGLNK